MRNIETHVRETMRLNIINKRKELGLTQTELAQLVGLKTNTIGSWEQGYSSPDIDTIVMLLKIFKMDFYEFTGFEKDS